MDNLGSDPLEQGVDGLTGQDESLTDAVSAFITDETETWSVTF